MKIQNKKLKDDSISIDQIVENTDTKQKALHFALKIFVIFLILGTLSATIWQIMRSRQGKILPKVTISNLNVGGKNPTEAKTLVDSYITQINTQGPEIKFESESFNPKLSELGVYFDSQKTIDEAYSFGRRGNLVNRFKENIQSIYKNYNIALVPAIDEKKLDDYTATVSQSIETKPVDAALAYTNDQFVITPSKKGLGLNKDNLKKSINSFVQDNNQNKITLATIDLTPSINEKDALEAKAQTEKYLSTAPIKMVFEDKKFTIDAKEIASWIDVTTSKNQIKAEISSVKMKKSIDSMTKEIEIEKIDREITDGTNEVHIEGQDGRGVDTSKIASEINNRLSTGVAGDKIQIPTFAILKEQKTYYPTAVAGRFPGRYIDINLSEQTLRAFDGTQLVNQFLISSGTYTHPTPVGQFSVYGKSRVTRMKGDGYDLPGVEWVSWWSGDYSIHGTYWHNNFGNRMSHGCINASNTDAEWIYNWDEIGTAVYIHD